MSSLSSFRVCQPTCSSTNLDSSYLHDFWVASIQHQLNCLALPAVDVIHDVVELHGEFLPVMQLTEWADRVDITPDLHAFLEHLVERRQRLNHSKQQHGWTDCHWFNDQHIDTIRHHSALFYSRLVLLVPDQTSRHTGRQTWSIWVCHTIRISSRRFTMS